MTSFDFDISEKDLVGGQFVSKASRRLIAAFVQKMRDENLTKQRIADLLEVDKSTVSRMLRGNSNLTLRTIGELAWAMDLDPDLALQPFADAPSNHKTGAVISVKYVETTDKGAALGAPQIHFLTGSHP